MDPAPCFAASYHTIAPKVRSAAFRHTEPLSQTQERSSANSHASSVLALTGSAALARYLQRQRRSRTRVHAVGPVVAAAAAAAKVAAAGKLGYSGVHCFALWVDGLFEFPIMLL